MIHAAAIKLAAVVMPARNIVSQEHVVHAIVVVIVVLAGTILRETSHLDNNTISIVYGTAIGYAAGRSGTRPAITSRKEDDAQT